MSTIEVKKNCDLGFEFIKDIKDDYLNLNTIYNFSANASMIDNRHNPGWRNDFKFLFELCESFKYHIEFNKWPVIKWSTLPSIHSSRWNSRGIYCIMAYFLIPDLREKLHDQCKFISLFWSPVWFSNKKCNKDISQLLNHQLKNKKSKTTFKNFWNFEEPLINVPITNIVAERAIDKMMHCIMNSKTIKNANSKFLIENVF